MRERRIGQVTLAAQPLATVGSCVAAFRNISHIAGRTVVYIAAPLVMHLIFILALLPGLKINQIGTSVAWQEVFVLVNVMLLLENLTPRQVAAGPAPLNSDGMSLLRFARRAVKPEDLHMSYFWLDMLYSSRAGDYARSVEAGQAGLALYPDQQYLRNGLAAGLIALKDYDQALPILRDLLSADEGVTEDVRALARNNLAFATLELGVSGAELDQALEDARLAYQMVPWMPEIRGTLGAVLVAEGQTEEGLAHLLAAYPDLQSDLAKANNLTYQALAKWQLGDQDSASDLLQRAMELDPSEESATRAKARFQTGELAYSA